MLIGAQPPNSHYYVCSDAKLHPSQRSVLTEKINLLGKGNEALLSKLIFMNFLYNIGQDYCVQELVRFSLTIFLKHRKRELEVTPLHCKTIPRRPTNMDPLVRICTINA